MLWLPTAACMHFLQKSHGETGVPNESDVNIGRLQHAAGQRNPADWAAPWLRTEDRSGDVSDPIARTVPGGQPARRPRRTSAGFCWWMIATGCLASSLVLAQDGGPDRTALPRLADMELPSAGKLLQAEEKDEGFDWVVLKGDAVGDLVVVTEMLYPRPDTLKKMDDERKLLEATKPAGPDARRQQAERLDELRSLIIRLPGDSSEYRLPLVQIREIILFEDLMLRRVDRLLEEGDIRRAYDLLLSVERAIPGWEKSLPRFEQLLLREAELKAQAGEPYAALALLDELAARNLQNAELQPRYSRTINGMITEALAAADYARARYLIGRIERHFPEDPAALTGRMKLSELSTEMLNRAIQLSQQRDLAEAAELAHQAEVIWPLTGNSRAAWAQIVSRYQVLRVAVDALGHGELVFPGIRDSELRHRELTEVSLFEAGAADDMTYYRSGFFEKWDQSDLGREVLLTLRETRPYWQSQPVLTASQIADAIARRTDPTDPLFNSRLASFVSEFSVPSPTELKLRFSRVPMNLESLLRFPVTAGRGAAPAEGAAAESTDDETAAALLSTRFHLVRETDLERVYRRRIPEPDGPGISQYHVAEIRERRYPGRSQTVQAVIRGDADFLPHVLPWEIDAFQASPNLIALKRALPVTHVITFNPLSNRISSAQMRRALSLAIDRDSILQNVVLRDPTSRHGRISSAAWRLGSYATNPLEQPPGYNLRLAYALRVAAENQLKIAELQKLEQPARAAAKARREDFDGDRFRADTNVDHIRLPALRMVVEPEETAIAAADRILVYWKTIGFDVELISGAADGSRLADVEWDLMYRRVRMEEPLFDLWPLLANDTSLDVARLRFFPDWMRQELIGLDYSGSFVEAQNRLFTIHRHIAAQAFLIPLWEVDDYVVFHKTISGFVEGPVSVYQNAERWAVRP